MKILIEITHPAHYHFFKYAIQELKRRGHKVLVTARKKDVLIELLKKDKVKFILLSKLEKGKLEVYWEFLKREIKLFKVAKRFNPDIITGLHNPAVAHVGWLLRKKSIVFSTSEHQKLMERLTLPFVTKFCIPSCYYRNLGKKQIKYKGYHELAYLHPNRFEPKKDFLRKYKLKEKKYIVIRLVSWDAHHDIGHQGIKELKILIDALKKIYPVYIISEQKISKKFEKYITKVPPEEIHSLLYYSALYVGEGAAMAAESAVLGTPAIYVNTIKQGYLDDLERYGLLYNQPGGNSSKILKESKEILKIGEKEWKKRRKKLISEKIDVTKFIVKLFTKNE